MWVQKGRKNKDALNETSSVLYLKQAGFFFFVGLFLIFCKRALHYLTHMDKESRRPCGDIKRCGAPPLPPPQHLPARKHTWVTVLDTTWEAEADVDAGPNRRRGVFDCPTNLCALCDNSSQKTEASTKQRKNSCHVWLCVRDRACACACARARIRRVPSKKTSLL